MIMLLMRKTPRLFLENEGGKNLEATKNAENARSCIKIAINGKYNNSRENANDATEGMISAGTATYMMSFKNNAA